MILSMKKDELIKLVNLQLENFFMCNKKINDYIDMALSRLEKCLNSSANKYNRKENNAFFSPYHSGQYALFLYYLANTIWKSKGDHELCAALYYLNKALNSVDWYFELDLPDIFGVEHPLGSVLGRARYSDYLFFYQGCTIGGTKKGNEIVYPMVGEYVTLYANSSVIGNSKIGDYVVIGMGATVKNEDIPNNSLVFGSSPNLTIIPKTRESIKDLITNLWL